MIVSNPTDRTPTLRQSQSLIMIISNPTDRTPTLRQSQSLIMIISNPTDRTPTLRQSQSLIMIISNPTDRTPTLRQSQSLIMIISKRRFPNLFIGYFKLCASWLIIYFNIFPNLMVMVKSQILKNHESCVA